MKQVIIQYLDGKRSLCNCSIVVLPDDNDGTLILKNKGSNSGTIHIPMKNIRWFSNKETEGKLDKE